MGRVIGEKGQCYERDQADEKGGAGCADGQRGSRKPAECDEEHEHGQQVKVHEFHEIKDDQKREQGPEGGLDVGDYGAGAGVFFLRECECGADEHAQDDINGVFDRNAGAPCRAWYECKAEHEGGTERHDPAPE